MLKPDSLKACVLPGQGYATRGGMKDAFQCYNPAAKIFPSYDIPYLRAGELIEQLGDKPQARSLFEKAAKFAVPTAKKKSTKPQVLI